MIVCHCNALTDRAIEATVVDILSEGSDRPLTTGAVVNALGARRKCSGCLRMLTDVITECSRRCGCDVCPKTVATGTTTNNLVELEVGTI